MKILIVGCGAMGGALLRGWEKHYDLSVIDPTKSAFKNLNDLENDYVPDVIILAVKPQLLAMVLPDYSKFKSSLFISVAAGVRISFYEKIIGLDIRIVRVMPNLAVQVGEGASAYVANTNCTNADINTVKELFSKVGIIKPLADENMFDSITALSGSGPAYIFYLSECMAEAAIKLGLDKDLAYQFAMQTMIGAGFTLKHTETSLENLRANVTSKGGTTEAALNVLMHENQLQNMINSALSAAQKRALEMANS